MKKSVKKLGLLSNVKKVKKLGKIARILVKIRKIGGFPKREKYDIIIYVRGNTLKKYFYKSKGNKTMAKTFEITCPHCGEVLTVEAPVAEKKRGQLYGIAIEDMTDEQLKREIINANSVLYKAKQRGASAEVIAANQARVDAAKAEKAKRHPVVTDTTDAVAEVAEAIDEAVAAEV